ncbi:MAG TPA: alpha/beta hydrolase, partial [Silvibacterium sp.]|nr:alpha/beta hydrolase [Silvibacterium sp.]
MSDSSQVVTTPSSRPSRKLSDSRSSFRFALNRVFLVLICLLIGLGLYIWLRPLELLFTVVQAKLRLDGIKSEFTHVDGYRIHYYTGGSGPPIVLVHGLGGRAEDWAQLMPQLVHGGHRVYALDLLGYGRSSRPSDASYSIPQEAGIVEKFIAGQKLDRIDLAGWSMGGWIAMRVALDEPERIRRLAIYDSVGVRYDVPFDTSLFWPDTPAKLASLRDLLSPIPALPVPGIIQRDIFRLTQRNGWVVQRSMRSMLTGADLLDGKLATVKMPLLIVWGKQDHIAPVSVGYTIHALVPQSVLEIYDGCGHLAARECSDRIGPNTLAFLNADPPLT